MNLLNFKKTSNDAIIQQPSSLTPAMTSEAFETILKTLLGQVNHEEKHRKDVTF